MKTIRTNVLLLIVVLCSVIMNAQNCEYTKNKAIELKSNLDKNNPKTYYTYGNFLGNLSVNGNKCLNEKLLKSFYNILLEGANNGDVSCAARLVMISQYALYNYPYQKSKAFDIARKTLLIAEKSANEDINTFNDIGWVVPTIFLSNYNIYKDKKNISPKLAEAVFELLKRAEAPIPQESDLNSFKYAKNDYNKVLARAYNLGDFNSVINYKKGMQFADKVGEGFKNNFILDIIEKENTAYTNPAALTFLGAANGRRLKTHSVDDKFIAMYKNNKHLVDTKSKFINLYQIASPKFKEIIDAAYPDILSVDEKWNIVKNSNLEEPKAYKNWEFLTKTEQDNLFNEAIKDHKSSIKETERFQIYKAMVANNQNKAILYLAKAHQYGRGVIEDGEKAVYFYKKAMVYDELKGEAAYAIAQMYDGVSVHLEEFKVDWVKAAKYYKLSTNYNSNAYTMLGEMALFGIGGFAKSKEKAMEYFKKGSQNGNEKARINALIVNSIPHIKNKISKSNYSLAINNLEELKIRLIPTSKKLSVTIDYNVKSTIENSSLMLFPAKTTDFNLHYTTWSPSAKLKGVGQETVWIHKYGVRNGSRQIGVFSIIAESENGDQETVYTLPVAVCYLPLN